MLYVWVEPSQTLSFPVIEPGWAGSVITDTLKDLAGPEPQPLFAVTVIFPSLAPVIASIEAKVELPLHPEGNVHV
jgi:hypothetical protein